MPQLLAPAGPVPRDLSLEAENFLGVLVESDQRTLSVFREEVIPKFWDFVSGLKIRKWA